MCTKHSEIQMCCCKWGNSKRIFEGFSLSDWVWCWDVPQKGFKRAQSTPVVPPKMDYLRGHKASPNSKTSFCWINQKTHKGLIPATSSLIILWMHWVVDLICHLNVIRCHWHVCTHLEKTATKSSLGEGVEILVRNIHIVYVYTVFLYYICISIFIYLTVYDSRSIRTIVWPFVIMSNPKDIREVLPRLKKKGATPRLLFQVLQLNQDRLLEESFCRMGSERQIHLSRGEMRWWIQRVENGSQSMPHPNIVSMNLVEKHFTSFNLMFSYNLHARKYTWLCLLDMLAYWPVNVANMVFLFRNTFLI